MTEAVSAQPEVISPQKRRKNTEFWRACGFLYPYRKLVVISIISAFFVGALTTGGLAAMLPILRVLIKNDTIATWVDREVIAPRIGSTPIERSAWHYRALHGIAAHMPAHPVKAVAVVFGVIACLAVMSNIIRFFQEYLSEKSAISAVMDVRRHLYDRILHLPLNFFGKSGTSDVTSRLVSDSQVLQDGFKILLGPSVLEPMKAIGAFVLALCISWKLTLFLLLFVPIMGGVLKKFGKKMRRATRAALQRSASLLGQIEGTLVGIRVVKAASAERFERRRYRSILEMLRQEMLKMARYEAYATPTMETISLLVVGIIVLYATYLVRIDHSLGEEGFFGMFAALAMMGESLRRLSKVTTVIQRSNAAAARIFEILDLPTEHRERLRDKTRTQRKIPQIQREIVFENVTFSYPGSPQPAVNNVSLTVAKGSSVAIVGRNGSGKTTLLALLPRFFDPQFGRVMIDGTDVRDATLRSLRRQIGIVTQESIVFPGTIAENIAYGMPNTPRSAIEDAARRAFCDEFIAQKPQGYDTPLDGLGAQLSGGQRQRLNIARAILRKSPILILDEATSQVDAESEHLIQKAVESIMHDRTTFVIAHRFSTILSADTIVVMDRGQIVGQGKHDELLRTCPTYKQLYERQLFAA